ncbi:DPP IV N-terminal domain-containing protein [Sphingobacterium composti Ten et al. 2007 non Yoo et al. 2007]|uniref:DPP IV N-terminal domain-containing protein n=1 Tax=Sphingobacterium composti TaxID=363260 RepID=UPI0013577C7A|nr:DPP IV N-terminal domain-containing protein [Sphingobacterium composti Ten et al. 2007 non Yoo et al. 2007]
MSLLLKKNIYKIFCFITLFLAFGGTVDAQYFGQNKMRYKKLNFKVYDTPHFNIYYYLENDSMMRWLSKESEVWYDMHQQVFQDTFARKNPIIFYNNHPEFQQTTAINGEISVGTGGVTEAFKQRVIMPIMQINQQTRHVLGHEMVHAFQYRVIMEGGDSTRLENIGNIPLWMIEGMAEYFSIGKKDAFTSMWMRDAYLHKDIPSLKQMTEQSYNYFPYRYGQAFWSFIGSTYGDTVIMPLFIETAKYGYEFAMRRVFGYDAQTMSTLWKNSIEQAYRNLGRDTTTRPIGINLINQTNAGEMNLSPTISPDGKYVVYLSEQDLFSIDLYLADANTGKRIRKLGSKLTNKDIDEFSFLESAGSFSPDSKKFAFSVFSQGKNKLMVVDIETGKPLLTEAMGDIIEFANIAWAPDGETVAFSGLVQGHSDLYTYNTRTKELKQLTDDVYSDYQPNYSRDGKYIVFSTDRLALQSDSRAVTIPMNLALYEVTTGKITNIDVFPNANNLNPQFSGDGTSIFFLSNSDGFRNMYRYHLSSSTVERLTDYFTGISGITEYSPAISVSANDDIVYSFFKKKKYNIYKANVSEFVPVQISAHEVDMTAAILPPNVDRGVNVVNRNLSNFNVFQRISDNQINNIAYTPKFKLDYLANSGVGMSVGSRYGAGISSGIQGQFSDILGYNQIFSALNINGEIYDFGGQVAYINQRSRLNWGGALSHIPYMTGFSQYGYEDFGYGNELAVSTYMIRTFQTQAEGFVAYPFNRNHRFEVGAAISRYGYRVDKWRQSYYYGYGDRQRITNEEASGLLGGNFKPFIIQQVNSGFVGDNAVFGITAPLQGFRYRLGAEQYFGDYNFTALNIDLRKYNRYKPVTIAARLYSYMRLGEDNKALYPLYIGYPYLIRGYESGNVDVTGNTGFEQLSGSKMAVGNFEIRIPFTGPEKLALIKSGLLFSDLNFFLDGGVAWDRNQYTFDINNPTDTKLVHNTDFKPVYSAGVSLRINLFGAMILEPYYAIPFQKTKSKFGTFGLNFAPGW